MRFTKIFFLLFVISSLLHATEGDTVVVNMKKITGFGPFGVSGSPLRETPDDNPWHSTEPVIKGLPDSLRNFLFTIFHTDFKQHAFQSYIEGKLSKEYYFAVLEDWVDKYEPDKYSKRFVKEAIAIAAGYDKKGNLLLFVDKNNNFDLSDDNPIIISPKSKSEQFFERIKNIKPVEATFEYYDGKQIKKSKISLLINYGPDAYGGKKEGSPIKLFVGIDQYFKGNFVFNNVTYNIYIRNKKGKTEKGYIEIKLCDSKNDNLTELSEMESQSSDQFLKAGNNYFKIANITPGGKYLTLVRQNVTSETQGTQPGFKAMDFNAKTVSGNPISLKDLRGKYVYLDFWGSWCMPCREEIPGLKKLYEDYKDKSFIIIGIANDRVEKLRKFVKENNISWPQILEEKDKKIIYKYKISGYPTTFLINPAGTILYKNLRFKELGDKLAKIFKN